MREFWIKKHTASKNISNQHDLYTAVETMVPQNPDWLHVIEKSAYDELKKERDSLLSKVDINTVSRVKIQESCIVDLVTECNILKSQLEEANADYEQVKKLMKAEIERLKVELLEEKKNAGCYLGGLLLIENEVDHLKEHADKLADACEMGAFHHNSCPWLSGKECCCANEKVKTTLANYKKFKGE